MGEPAAERIGHSNPDRVLRLTRIATALAIGAIAVGILVSCAPRRDYSARVLAAALETREDYVAQAVVDKPIVDEAALRAALPELPQNVSVVYTARISYKDSAWLVHDEVGIPIDAEDHIDDVLIQTTKAELVAEFGPLASILDKTKPGDGLQRFRQKIPTDWRQDRRDTGLVLSRDRQVPSNAGLFMGIDTINLPQLIVEPGIGLAIGPQSMAFVRAPRNMINAVDPPGKPSDLPGGFELTEVSLAQVMEPALRVEALALPFQNDAGKLLARQGILLMVAGFVVVAFMAFMQDRLKAGFRALFGSRRHTEAPTNAVDVRPPRPRVRTNRSPPRR